MQKKINNGSNRGKLITSIKGQIWIVTLSVSLDGSVSIINITYQTRI